MVESKMASAKEHYDHRHSMCKRPGIYVKSCLLIRREMTVEN